MKAIIVGGGISGLSCGIYLSKNNVDVTIYEKNPYAGGFATTWLRKGSLIDGCMHWMLGTKEGTKLNKIWHDVGVFDHISIYNPSTFCSIKYEDNWFHFYNDVDKFEKEMRKYSDNDEEEITIFIEAIKAMGVMEIPSDLPYELEDPSKFKMNMNILRKLRYYLKLSIGQVANRFHSKIIQYALKNCLVNENFSAYYFIQTISNFMSLNDSIPYGCTKSIQEGMLNKYLSLGGKIIYSKNIDEVIIKDNKAIGIKVDNEIEYADYVVLGTDIHESERLIQRRISPYDELDSNKEEYKTYSYCIASYKTKSDVSNLPVAVIKKIDKYNLSGIESDTLSYRQYGYDKELILNGNTTIQVYLTTYEKDYELIKRMTKEEYKSFKKKLGEFYLEKLKKELQVDLELIDVLTPLTYERYGNSYKGTFMPFVLGPGLNQVIRSQIVDGISNLILANQWLMLPGGSCVAVTMGKFASQLILHDMGKDYIF